MQQAKAHTQNFDAIKQVIETQFQTVERIINLSAGDIIENVAILFIQMSFRF